MEVAETGQGADPAVKPGHGAHVVIVQATNVELDVVVVTKVGKVEVVGTSGIVVVGLDPFAPTSSSLHANAAFNTAWNDSVSVVPPRFVQPRVSGIDVSPFCSTTNKSEINMCLKSFKTNIILTVIIL